MRFVAMPPTASSFFFDEGLNRRGGAVGSGVTRPPLERWEERSREDDAICDANEIGANLESPRGSSELVDRFVPVHDGRSSTSTEPVDDRMVGGDPSTD